MGTVSAVPSGLAPADHRDPNVETLGYYQESLGDKDLPAYGAIPSGIGLEVCATKTKTPLRILHIRTSSFFSSGGSR